MIKPLIFAAAIVFSTGCVMSSQTIQLNEQLAIAPVQASIQRDALVRVVDNRTVSPDWLGHRGGRLPENSPLLSEQPLDRVLTARLQDSLKQLGFGAESPLPPLRVQLTINEFLYQCNEGMIVNECQIQMAFQVQVIDQDSQFSKPYQVMEKRSLAASPIQSYNQEWVNETLDKIWQHMFSDAQLRRALGLTQ